MQSVQATIANTTSLTMIYPCRSIAINWFPRTVFVRDRGQGFDPGAVPADRKGLAESVHARIERHGGLASVRSSPGEGTEVTLTMPRSAGEREPSRS